MSAQAGTSLIAIKSARHGVIDMTSQEAQAFLRAAIECRRWMQARDEILAALKGDPVAISNNFKEVERMRVREREENDNG